MTATSRACWSWPVDSCSHRVGPGIAERTGDVGQVRQGGQSAIHSAQAVGANAAAIRAA